MTTESEVSVTSSPAPRRKNPDTATVTFAMTKQQHRKMTKIANELSKKTGDFYNRSMTLRWLIDNYVLKSKT